MDTYCQFLSKNSTRPVSLWPPESQGVGCHFSAHYRATVCLIGVTKQHLGRAHTKIPSSSPSTCIHFNVIFIQKSLVVTFLLQQNAGDLDSCDHGFHGRGSRDKTEGRSLRDGGRAVSMDSSDKRQHLCVQYLCLYSEEEKQLWLLASN